MVCSQVWLVVDAQFKFGALILATYSHLYWPQLETEWGGWTEAQALLHGGYCCQQQHT